MEKLESKMDKLLERFKRMDDLIKNQQVLHESFKSFNKDFEDFRKKFDEVMGEFETLKKNVKTLEAENRYLKSELKSIRNSQEESFYINKSNVMEIVGYPPSPVEDLKQTVIDVGVKIGVNISGNMLRDVKRITRKGEKLAISSVTFAESSICESFIEKGRKARLKGSDLGCVGLKNPVFFNECLSSYTRRLLFLARNFRREQSWKYVWVKGGKVFLRKADREMGIRISCPEDLDTLVK